MCNRQINRCVHSSWLASPRASLSSNISYWTKSVPLLILSAWPSSITWLIKVCRLDSELWVGLFSCTFPRILRVNIRLGAPIAIPFPCGHVHAFCGYIWIASPRNWQSNKNTPSYIVHDTDILKVPIIKVEVQSRTWKRLLAHCIDYQSFKSFAVNVVQGIQCQVK